MEDKTLTCDSQSRANPTVNALLRVLIISLGPIVFNAALLIVLFFVSLFMGPMLNRCCGNFGSIMAGIAHIGSVLGMIAFFEFGWLLDRWDISHAVLLMIATIAIQRFVVKLAIALFLSREFKTEGVNIAWWQGSCKQSRHIVLQRRTLTD